MAEECCDARPADVPAVPEAASARLRWTCGDRSLDYEARAAHLDVVSDEGDLLARMFSLSYLALADGSPDPARPVTFCFNGGPGCASVPINFGGFGPRRVRPEGTDHLGRGVVEDNPWTLLGVTDLVFLDAPATGWSVVPESAGDAPFGVDADADAFSRAIMAWLEENGRWSSPKYLIGESYGTIRNSVLMRLLGERNVFLDGVVMLSALFDWVQTLPGEDLYYLGMLPTYAATAKFFGKVPAAEGSTDDEWFDEAVEFGEGTLAHALLMGDRLGAEEELEVARGISRLIGLPADYVAARHLRIELTDFRTQLLRDEGRVVGRLDTRFAGDASTAAQTLSGHLSGDDAADEAIESAWSAAFRSFVHDELGYRAPARYLNNNYERVGRNWKWAHKVPGTALAVGAPNVSYDIATALRRSPRTRLAVLGGRYDAATTWWNVVHDLSRQFLSDELRANVEFHRYGCGHMAYVDERTAELMRRDLGAFIRA